MSKELRSINVNKDTWMYAEKKGLCVVRRIRNPDSVGLITQTDMFYIPWGKVKKAFRTHQRRRKP